MKQLLITGNINGASKFQAKQGDSLKFTVQTVSASDTGEIKNFHNVTLAGESAQTASKFIELGKQVEIIINFKSEPELQC